MSRSRSHRASHDSGAERWLVSYADFITLLFAFFVVLFASSNVDKAKIEQFTEAYGSYLEGGPRLLSLGPPHATKVLDQTPPPSLPSAASRLAVTAAEMGPVEHRMREILEQLLEDESVRMSVEARGLVISLQEAALFPAGDAAFRPNSETLLATIAHAVSVDRGRHVRLEGHTDNRPIRTAQYPSNWELSSARATEVMRALARLEGLDERTVSIAGYGPHRPVASNDTAEGRAQNRRVDIVLLADDAAEREPAR